MSLFRLPRWLKPAAVRAIHLHARFFRPLTMGVRAVIFDDSGRVFLVRHSYVPGWFIPGGAVEPGETVREALRREVAEEANIAIRGEPVLYGVFFNRNVSRRDHVLVYIVRDFTITGPRPPDWEIIDTGFFDPDALPDDTTPATRARLAEIARGGTPDADW